MTLESVPLDDRYLGPLKLLEHRDFWMDPAGNVAPMFGMWEHIRWAIERGVKDDRELMAAGWLKKSGSAWMRDKLSQAQLDRIFDYHAQAGLTFEPEMWHCD